MVVKSYRPYDSTTHTITWGSPSIYYDFVFISPHIEKYPILYLSATNKLDIAIRSVSHIPTHSNPQCTKTVTGTPEPEHDLTSTEPNLFEATTIHGRGTGLVAVRDIPRGTRVLAEAPAMQIYMKSARSILAQVQASCGRLAPDKRALWEDLSHVSAEKVVPQAELSVLESEGFEDREQLRKHLAIFYTNHFLLDFLAPYTAGVFLEISRLNHSCVPNLHWAYNEELGHMTIHATRDITAGAELTVSYIPGDMRTREQRHLRLEPYDFVCECEACRDPESDDRRTRLADLRSRIAKFTDGAPTEDEYRMALQMIEEFLDLYEKENLAGRERELR